MNVSLLIKHALGAHQQGLLDQASSLYEQILQQEPENFAALQLLGTLRSQQGRYLEAIRLTERALVIRPDDFGTLANYGSVLMAAGRHLDALEQFDRALIIKPDFFEALYNRAVTLAQLKRFAQAVDSYDKALALRPNSPECLYNRGISLTLLGWPKDALASYDRALALNPRLAPAHDNRGNVLRELGQLEQAMESYDKAISLAPDDFRAHYNRAVALTDLERFEEAIASYERSLGLQPNFADASFNLGLVLLKLERFTDSLARFDKALAARPSHSETLNNRGVALWRLNRFDESLASYNHALAGDPGHAATLLNRALLLQGMGRFSDALTDYDRAIAIDPRDARAWNGRGSLLHAMKRNRDALENFEKALELKPDLADALTNRGLLRWTEHGDYAGATSDLRKALTVDPHQAYAAGELHHLKMYGADWEGFDADKAMIDDGVRTGRRVVRPFVYQALSLSPADLQACSRIFAASLPAPSIQPPSSFRYSHDRIRIGYVSGEFREQATAYLMAGLYERHDRDRFEVIAIDSGGGDGSAMRKRLEAAFDKIIYIANIPDAQAVDLIRASEIDILVNLNGYFGTARMGLFARRAAPVQINYLGFPATLGDRAIDYIIADKVVIPQDERHCYDEQVVYLPDCYQANDDKRPIAPETPTRAAMGLPDTGFVFCNFNQSYKITPSTFASWMRILKAVDGSVLWLLAGKPPFAENLARAARQHGVASNRLIFARSLPPDQHLARLKLADLFLDSLPYNAHTTASDALWAGLPLLTCRGTTFPGRVAASLLTAAGLPELIAQSQDAYEVAAIRLARDSGALRALRKKLADQRSSCPLFDTDRFRQNIEAAYAVMVAAQRRGEAPRSFSIDAAFQDDV